MNDNLNVLKELGAQKIHNDTHISKEHIQEILHETFDGLNAVQFTGFISILEREYNIDLSELKSQGLAYFGEKKPISIEDQKIFIAPQKQKNNTTLYVLIGILVFIATVYYKFSYVDSKTLSVETIDNTKIDKVTENMRPVLEIKNSVIEIESNDINDTNNSENSEQIVLEEKNSVEKKQEIRTLKVLPKNKVWVGYIEIETNKKYQKIFRKEHEIDTTKNWLLLFGAGNIKLEVNGEIKKYASEQNMRFKYVDGVFSKIDVTEFKSLNRGRKW